MPMTPAIDVLLDARALLARPGGWIKGTEVAPREEGGFAYCIQGAIAEADGSPFPRSGATERVEDVVGIGIPAYNDMPQTSQADVVDVIDRAISAEWNGDPIRRRSLVSGMPISPELLDAAFLKFSEANGPANLIEPLDLIKLLDMIEPPFPPAA